jgi:ubiquinone biosynthesis protein COQ4
MKETIDRLRMLKAFVTLIADPSKTESVFELADLGRDQRGPLLDLTLEKIAEQEGFSELYEQNYSPHIPPLQTLATYAEGSFGRAFATHMLTNGLEIEFFPPVEGNGIEKYILERGRKTHDFWHVLTGYDTSIAGEVGLQGFTLAQLESPFSAILISGGLLHSILRAPNLFTPTVSQLFEGYEMGRRAKSLIGIPIETMLEVNLAELRDWLALTPCSSRLLHTS